MKGGSRRKAGTNIRREPDVAAIREGLAAPGIDPRTWVARGTVATVHDDGAIDFGDGDAVVIAPRGIDVDVVIEPHQDLVTCRYGHQFGDAVLLFPIRPGQLVTVIFPEGDPAAIPEIVKVGSGPHTPIPVEDADQLPIFRNDRALLYGQVPIEVRAAGDARVVVNPDGTVVINQGEKGVARLDDSIVTKFSSDDIVALATKLLATAAFVGSGVGPFPVPSPDLEVGGQITSASETVKSG